MDLKIFVLTPDDIRLCRRIERDINDRGRTVIDVLQQYNRFVKPAYDDFIKPTMKHADIIIPFHEQNERAVEMLIQNLKIKMREIERKRAKQSETRLRSTSIDELMTPSVKGTARKSSQSQDSEDQYGSPNLEGGDGINSTGEAIDRQPSQNQQAEEIFDGAQAGAHLILPSSEKVRNQGLQLLKVVNSIQKREGDDDEEE